MDTTAARPVAAPTGPARRRWAVLAAAALSVALAAAGPAPAGAASVAPPSSPAPSPSTGGSTAPPAGGTATAPGTRTATPGPTGGPATADATSGAATAEPTGGAPTAEPTGGAATADPTGGSGTTPAEPDATTGPGATESTDGASPSPTGTGATSGTATPSTAASTQATDEATAGAAATRQYLTTYTDAYPGLDASGGTGTPVRLDARTAVDVLGASGSWSRVAAGTTTGWVPTSRLSAEWPPMLLRYMASASGQYSEPTSASTRVWSLDRRTPVELLNVSGTWAKVRSRTHTGWVPAYRVVGARPAAALRYATSTSAMLRSGTSASAAVLDRLDHNRPVEYLNSDGWWVKARSGTVVGWVPAGRLSASTTDPVYRYTRAPAGAVREWDGSGGLALMLGKNTRVQLMHDAGEWIKVRTGSRTGWVRDRDLSPRTTPTYIRWTERGYYARSGPGTGYSSIGLVGAWTRVEYHYEHNGWIRVGTPRGLGWLPHSVLTTTGYYPLGVYGTLRHGQSAYPLLEGKTVNEQRVRVPYHDLYLQPDRTWLSYMVPTSRGWRSVVTEAMTIRKSEYGATLERVDNYERYDPSQPHADQHYVREVVRDAYGRKGYSYVAGSKMASYLRDSGIRVTGGDYLARY